MSRFQLFTARVEALAVSPASAGSALDRIRADAAIGAAVRAHGVRGCAAELAYEYGEHPDATAQRTRWAIEMISELYGRP
jgi:hypothetical protein